MPVHVAFLRAINVGGRTIRMDALRGAFEALGLDEVSTFIASGNVIFRSRSKARTLETRIEKHLQQTFGLHSDTFIRSVDQLAAVLEAAPFPAAEGTTYVGFLRGEPAADAKAAVEASESEVDALRMHGRELFWLTRARLSESKLTGARLEKLLGMPMTLRNLRTVQRLVDRLT